MTAVALHSYFYPSPLKKMGARSFGLNINKTGRSPRICSGAWWGAMHPTPIRNGLETPFSRPNDSTVLREKRARVFTSDGVVFGVRQTGNAT